MRNVPDSNTSPSVARNGSVVLILRQSPPHDLQGPYQLPHDYHLHCLNCFIAPVHTHKEKRKKEKEKKRKKEKKKRKRKEKRKKIKKIKKRRKKRKRKKKKEKKEKGEK